MSRNDPESIPMNDVSYVNSKYLAIFQKCDSNNDNHISFDELENYIIGHNEECNFISKRILKKIHKKADANKDDQLDLNEFIELLEDKDFQYYLHNYVSTYIHHLIPHQPTAVGTFQLRSVRIDDTEKEADLCNEYSCCPPPIFMLLISLLEFALFLTDELTQKDSSLTASGITGKYLLYDPNKKKEVWRFVTYMFVHIGYNHLIMNLIVQLALGIPLEMVNKWWRVLTVYFLGGITGCLLHSIIDGSIRLGGASGGVYALLAAHLAQIIMNWDSMRFASIQFIVFGVMIVADLGTAACRRYYLNEFNGIGVTCHIGGAIAGVLVGIYVLKNLNVTSVEKYIWWGALILYLLLTGATVITTILI